MSAAAQGLDTGLAGAPGWEWAVVAGSSHTSMCASERGVGAGVVVGPSVHGRPVAVSRSGSTSAGGRAPGRSDGVCASGCGRGSWSASESGS